MTDFNASDRDVSRAIRSWLHEDRHEDASRLAGAVLDQVEATQRRRTSWWSARRTPLMNKILGYGVAAAAVIVALLVGVQLLSSPNASIGSGEEPTATPTPTIEPTPEPTPSPSAEAGLPKGPVLLASGKADSGETLHPPLTVTIPAPGWLGDQGGGTVPGGILLKDWGESDGAGMIVFARTEYYVYADPCNWQTTIPDEPVTTVDGFVEALAAQPSRNASEPVDITVGGYSGKSITLETPADLDLGQCDEQTFASYSCGEDAAEAAEAPCGFHQGPGETSVEYILDVDDMIVAWHTGYGAEAPAEVIAELEAIVRSATFGE